MTIRGIPSCSPLLPDLVCLCILERDLMDSHDSYHEFIGNTFSITAIPIIVTKIQFVSSNSSSKEQKKKKKTGKKINLIFQRGSLDDLNENKPLLTYDYITVACQVYVNIFYLDLFH